MSERILKPDQIIIGKTVYDCNKDYYKLEDLLPFSHVVKGGSEKTPPVLNEQGNRNKRSKKINSSS